MKAIWNGKVIAESNKTINIEGNRYFPADTIKKEYFSESNTHTKCHWKGLASYHNITVDGKTNKDAAWFYPEPKPMADKIKDYIAFWKGVEIIEE
jgi:uncharacterized protein (DUF427 family)